jgi:hypothetical protein
MPRRFVAESIRRCSTGQSWHHASGDPKRQCVSCLARRARTRRSLEQQFRGSADHIAEDALRGCDVLMSAQPSALLVLGDQAAGQAVDACLIGARALRAAPAIAHRGPPGARGAQLLGRERRCAAAAPARRRMGLRTDDPWFGHDQSIRTSVRLHDERAPVEPEAETPSRSAPARTSLRRAAVISGLGIATVRRDRLRSSEAPPIASDTHNFRGEDRPVFLESRARTPLVGRRPWSGSWA